MLRNRLPFLAEYAKSNRSKCKECSRKIAQDELRFAQIVPSKTFDDLIEKWYHVDCFFINNLPTTSDDFENFDNLLWEHQKLLKEKIKNNNAGSSTTDGIEKGQKRSNDGESSYGYYAIEYATSDGSTCSTCEVPIVNGDIRLFKKDDSEIKQKLNGTGTWYHVDCFIKIRETLGFFNCGEALPGFKTLNEENKKIIKMKLPKIENELSTLSPVKKIKTYSDTDENEIIMEKQNKELFNLKKQLKTLKRNELISLLNANNATVPSGPSRIIEKLADIMCFGVPNPCGDCKSNLEYTSGIGYKCNGNSTEWLKCENVNIDPPKKIFEIPNDLKEKFPFLSSFKPKIKKRVFKQTFKTRSPASVKGIDKNNNNNSITEKTLPLKGMQFIVHEKNKNDKDKMKKKIMLLGGTVVDNIHKNITAVITRKENFHENEKVIQDAKNFDIQVISDDFIVEIKDYNDTPISLLIKKKICKWGSDPSIRIAVTMAKLTGSPGVYDKLTGKQKFKLQVGGVVDPYSGHDETAHIYQYGDNFYNATFTLSNVQSGKNSFYILQILENDEKNEYWLFRRWGRIGTGIGEKKCDKMSLDNALTVFQKLYCKKTNNHWIHRENFDKKPDKMFLINVNDTNYDKILNKFSSNIESKLKKPVQELIRLIFNVNTMKKVMAEYELGTEIMPLGKLSKKQLQQAYNVLIEIHKLIVLDKKSPGSQRKAFIDASNRFYTLVPHSFGYDEPIPILDNEDIINRKSEMVDSLLDMEITYSLLNTETDSNVNPIDSHYKQLNTDIDVLDKNCEEFKMIQEYTKNTHAPTHLQYKLEIEDVFVIKRQGEEKRYEPFKKLHNRKLLWHGSRTTNFAGILSQGLRIAPPEAPATGYMFGKGIYFADMVSKSANYCCTSSQNSTGLLMLCEVALGNMYECFSAAGFKKLPDDYNSIFGVGRTHPDPNIIYKTKNDVEVPYGPCVPVELKEVPALLYNEYIVYDVAQVKTQYLVRMKFNYDDYDNQ